MPPKIDPLWKMAYDHRIIDGREAVLALVAMKEALEYPVSPLLEA